MNYNDYKANAFKIFIFLLIMIGIGWASFIIWFLLQLLGIAEKAVT